MQPLPPISMLLHRPAPEHREGPPPRLAPPPPPASSSSSYPSRVPCLPPNYSTSTSGRKLPSLAALYPFSPDSPVPSATPTTAEKPEGPLAPLDGDEKQEAKRIGMVDGAFRIWETQGREVKRKRYATSTDSRGYIPVIEYPLNSHLIMADSETGYVLITAIWRALGRTKADVVRLIESQPEIALLVRKVRGGQLQIQGTWLPFEIALTLARRVAWEIRHYLRFPSFPLPPLFLRTLTRIPPPRLAQLIPLFGPSFPSSCLRPPQPGYGTLVLSPTSAASSTRGSPRLLAFSTSKPRRDLKKRDEARAAALKAQNNPKRVTAGQAREGRRLAGTSAGGAVRADGVSKVGVAGEGATTQARAASANSQHAHHRRSPYPQSATAQHSESSLPFGPYYLPPLPLPPTGPLPRSLSFPSSLPSSASLFASSSTHLLSSLPPPPQPVAPAPPTMPAFPSYAHRAQLPPLRLAPISSILPPAMLYPYPTPCTATLPEGWGWEAKQGMQGGK